MRLVALGKYPHYRAGAKDLRLERATGLSPEARGVFDALKAAPPPAPPAAQPLPPRGWEERGGRDEVLRAFGLVQTELARVRAIGAAAMASADDSGSEAEAEGDLGFVF